MRYLYSDFIKEFKKDFTIWGAQELFYQLHDESYDYVDTTEEEIKKWKFYTIKDFIKVVYENEEDYNRVIPRIGFYPIDEAHKHLNYNVVAVSKPYNNSFYNCIEGFLVYDGDLSSYKFSKYRDEEAYKQMKQKLHRSYIENIRKPLDRRFRDNDKIN